MVHFPAWADMAYGFSHAYPGISRDGFPHSEIDGSKPVCGSPSLIAAYHVLHRLLAPRHPPYALSSLTIRTRTSGRPMPEPKGRTPVASSRMRRQPDPDPRHRHRQSSDTLRVCGRKTTVAEYSVVKERRKRSRASNPFRDRLDPKGIDPQTFLPPPARAETARPAQGEPNGGEYR